MFYAVGTGIGGITGPLVFQALIQQRSYGKAELALMIGAAMMIVGGIVELIFGVKAEGETLENIAKPLTAEDTPGSSPRTGGRLAPGAATA